MKHIISFLVCALLILSSSLASAVSTTYSVDLQRQADAGDVEALMELGYAYGFGEGVRQDYHKSNEYWLKAISHPKWNTINADVRGKVYFNLGVRYDQGRGVRQDYHKAVEYYKKAADLGYANAMFNLGAAYDNGKGV